MSAPDWEFREDADGTLDEIVLRDVKLVHVEMLNTGLAYLQFHYEDGTWGQVDIIAPNGQLVLSAVQEPSAGNAGESTGGQS